MQLPALMVRTFSSNLSFAMLLHFANYEQEWSLSKGVNELYAFFCHRTFLRDDLIGVDNVISLKFP